MMILKKIRPHFVYNVYRHLRIGCASGFWGDTTVASRQLIELGKIDFLVFDYLSEITMSLLTAVSQKNPKLGFVPDFLSTAGIGGQLKEIKRKGIRVIANAGGVNPSDCAAQLLQLAEKEGVSIRVAAITGDRLSSAQQQEIKGIAGQSTLQSACAYFGSGPLIKALDLEADIVICGRCVDSAIVLAPFCHFYKVQPTEYNALAIGSLGGHLVECGSQVTGGIFTDWETVAATWDTIGFPIVEFTDKKSGFITKPNGTGGMVSRMTVAEQLVYEIGDPARYMLPDVECDFSQVQLTEQMANGESVVRFGGAGGHKPSNVYKVSASALDGFRALAVCPIVGFQASRKAHLTANAILKRCRTLFHKLGYGDFAQVHQQFLGDGSSYGRSYEIDCREGLLWLAARHSNPKALDLFAKEIASAGTGMAPGLTTLVGGRPKVTPVLRYTPGYIDKRKVTLAISINGKHVCDWTDQGVSDTESLRAPCGPKQCSQTQPLKPLGYSLRELACARSGDKGNSVNIGVIARDPGRFGALKEHLTAARVGEYFAHFFDAGNPPKVRRYELPGIAALNFVLDDCLGGGGVSSLRPDPQGKAYAQMLLDLKL